MVKLIRAKCSNSRSSSGCRGCNTRVATSPCRPKKFMHILISHLLVIILTSFVAGCMCVCWEREKGKCLNAFQYTAQNCLTNYLKLAHASDILQFFNYPHHAPLTHSWNFLVNIGQVLIEQFFEISCIFIGNLNARYAIHKTTLCIELASQWAGT